MKDGNEDAINAMLPDKLPENIQKLYNKGHEWFLFSSLNHLEQIISHYIQAISEEKKVDTNE